MPVYPPRVDRPIKSGRYPHMSKHDAVIWERFLDAYAPRLTGVAYDVAVGGVIVDPALADEPTRRAWQYDTAMKIDAMALLEHGCWIIEVRPAANVSSIGSALCYVKMLVRDGWVQRPMAAVVLTDNATPDIRYCATALGVMLIEVGVAGEPEPAVDGAAVSVHPAGG
jgi:hypothetical protein